MCVKTQEGIPGQTPSILTALGTSQLIWPSSYPHVHKASARLNPSYTRSSCPRPTSAKKALSWSRFWKTLGE